MDERGQRSAEQPCETAGAGPRCESRVFQHVDGDVGRGASVTMQPHAAEPCGAAASGPSPGRPQAARASRAVSGASPACADGRVARPAWAAEGSASIGDRTARAWPGGRAARAGVRGWAAEACLRDPRTDLNRPGASQASTRLGDPASGSGPAPWLGDPAPGCGRAPDSAIRHSPSAQHPRSAQHPPRRRPARRLCSRNPTTPRPSPRTCRPLNSRHASGRTQDTTAHVDHPTVDTPPPHPRHHPACRPLSGRHGRRRNLTPSRVSTVRPRWEVDTPTIDRRSANRRSAYRRSAAGRSSGGDETCRACRLLDLAEVDTRRQIRARVSTFGGVDTPDSVAGVGR